VKGIQAKFTVIKLALEGGEFLWLIPSVKEKEPYGFYQ